MFSFGHCPNYLSPPPFPQFGQLVPLFLDVKNDVLARITEPSNDDYDNGVSDNCDHNFGTFDDFGVKNDQKVSHLARPSPPTVLQLHICFISFRDNRVALWCWSWNWRSKKSYISKELIMLSIWCHALCELTNTYWASFPYQSEDCGGELKADMNIPFP